MTKQEQRLDRFEECLPADPWVNPWQPDGTYQVDYELLTRLLSVAVGTTPRSGIVAGAADMWAAEELRRAGFDHDEVWPRRVQPRILPRDVRTFVAEALPKSLRTDVEQRYTHPKARRALPSEARVLGSAYTKQADVLIASWPAGVELLISTKTMLSSYQKNLRNRFEEGYGDAKNLRGRHPLAALGFLFIIGADVSDEGLAFATDMLRKLVREPDVYDCASLLVLQTPLGVGDDGNESQLVKEAPGQGAVPADVPAVTLLDDKVPDDLRPDTFFQGLIGAALERMPVTDYPEVRARIEQSAG